MGLVSKKKKKSWQFPGFYFIMFVFMLGVFFRLGNFDTVSMVYISGFLFVFVLPFGIIKLQDREKLRATKELIKILEGEE